MAVRSQTFAIITNRLIVKCWKKLNIPTKYEKNRTKPGNPYYLVLFENRTKPGTVLSETVLSGDLLYLCFLRNQIFFWLQIKAKKAQILNLLTFKYALTLNVAGFWKVFFFLNMNFTLGAIHKRCQPIFPNLWPPPLPPLVGSDY